KYWKLAENTFDAAKPAEPMSGDEELVKARERKAGLYIVDDIRNFSVDVTDGWEDGILVLRDLPEKNIGKGMKGGVVIVESSLSPDEVRSRLSAEDKTGGAILMRLPDPTEDEPNNTKLIDLEDDWLERMENE
ncbi:MAG: hypothetical protein M1324_04595, partial [Patescibacteria group bacterium]|nr:hypothetical protein [Patescibacteria group bacterium]